MDYTFQLYTFLDILIAALLAAFIGFERERLHKPAGLRTNMIVASFTCLIVSLVRPLIDFIEDYNLSEIIRTDPIRVLEAVVVGVSFIGAGTILKQEGKNKIYGLTTAATLLFSAALGMVVALHQYLLAVLVTALVLIINYAVKYFTKKYTDLEE